MFSYSIMPLDTDHLTELCDDIEAQYRTGGATLALFAMRMEPVGRPMSNIVDSFISKYILFRDELKRRGLECGILVQATIGHGMPLGDRLTFSPYINLTDGKESIITCPYDEGFVDHFRGVMERLARLAPKLIMVDDDFRLMHARPGRGCACPRHMAEFNKRAGTQLSREELYEALAGEDETAARYGEIFVEVQHDSRIRAARAMREGIDCVDPTLQGVFCTCGIEAGGEIARILAGRGNPSIMRINNGNYSNERMPRTLTRSLGRAAMQIALDSNRADVYLAETDTFPRNRHAVSAHAMHAQYVGTILEGVSGAKHFITRLRQFEPKSGVEYRRILARYAAFYNTLSDLVKGIRWMGARVPMPRCVRYNLAGKLYDMSWMIEVLERLGLPAYYGGKDGGTVFLSEDAPTYFSHGELMSFFEGTVVLSANAATHLENMGYGEYLGVSVRERQGKAPSGEWICINNMRTEWQSDLHELVPHSERVEIGSYACAFVEGKEPEKLFPSSTSFQNRLGGTSVVFAGNPVTTGKFENRFSYLNESRKEQFIDILDRAGSLPIYYPGDADVYLKAGALPDGRMLVAFFNLGLDPIEKIPLVGKKKITSAQYLDCDGTLKDRSWHREGNADIFDIEAGVMTPVVLLLTNSTEKEADDEAFF